MNDWPTMWCRIFRRGRVNRASGEQTTDDAVLPAPIYVSAYVGAPSVWPELPMGMIFNLSTLIWFAKNI